jgi:hypothetical protein
MLLLLLLLLQVLLGRRRRCLERHARHHRCQVRVGNKRLIMLIGR